jgi:hypothetical protein
MQNTMNPEGLTFEEWICAAGVAVMDHTSAAYEGHAWPPVLPYSYSYERADFRKDHGYQILDGIITTKAKLVRNKNVYYSKKIRQAWRCGEDPTEWRK